MKNRILSWGLILSLLLPMLPVSAVATEGDLSENGQMAAEAAPEADTDAADSSIYTVEDDTSTVILDKPDHQCQRHAYWHDYRYQCGEAGICVEHGSG